MKPVLDVEELRAAELSAGVEVDQLISRAGYSVARSAIDMLGMAYGKRVTVLAGKGNNGADGRVAAQHLRSAGAAVRVIDNADLPTEIAPCDLIIDAVFGTGFRGSWKVPVVHSPVLAVDIPSGLDAQTGDAGEALVADRTVTMIAHKSGLLFDPGFTAAGTVVVANLGIQVAHARGWLVDSLNPTYAQVPTRQGHKWTRAVTVVAGSPGMTGAADLVARAAMRAGAGMVRLCSPGVDRASWAPSEVVVEDVGGLGWADTVLEVAARTQVLVVGPGLGRSDETTTGVRKIVDTFDGTVIVDGDGLYALSAGYKPSPRSMLIVTPHDGEYKVLTGASASVDRRKAACDLATRLGAVVLLKGSTTVVSNARRELLVVQPDGRLGTAGTGDVLSGIIAAMVAVRGSVDDELVASGAFVHGKAAQLSLGRGLIASDLIANLPRVFADEVSRGGESNA